MHLRDRLAGALVTSVLIASVIFAPARQTRADAVDLAAFLGTGGAIRGLDYGPFRDGQSPDLMIFPTKAQLAQDMIILAQHTRFLRFYSEANGFSQIIPTATRLGLRIIPGAFLSNKFPSINDQEVSSLIDAANTYAAEARFPFLVVGTEPISQQGLSVDDLASRIATVRAGTGNAFAIATAEEWQIWINYPELASLVDVILVDVYPYYEGMPVDGAAAYAMQRVRQVQAAYPDHVVLIGETGWPSQGETIGQAIASGGNEEAYAASILRQTAEQNIGILYFEAFDEKWKIASTNMINQGHFGLFISLRNGKSGIAKGPIQNTFFPICDRSPC